AFTAPIRELTENPTQGDPVALWLMIGNYL
ncbi:MAG: hypothetical protein ACI9IN_000763, partial [Porticoccaceae bacterium]